MYPHSQIPVKLFFRKRGEAKLTEVTVKRDADKVGNSDVRDADIMLGRTLHTVADYHFFQGTVTG